MSWNRWGHHLLLAFALVSPVHAADVYVPQQLEGWESWVLDGKEYRQCPLYFTSGGSNPGDFVCTWPGALDISVDDRSGRFSQQWTVLADDAWLPLPGDTSYWPDRVTANGSAVAVVLREGVPSIRVAPGRYRVAGRFEWDERPGVLRVPPQSGLVTLTVNGERVSRPDVNRNGVFLGEREQATQARDAVSSQVYRLVADDIPTWLVTELQIEVSGSVREELFGPLLPDSYVPVSIDSQLPARLEADGKLRLQVRPGRWRVSLTARAPGVVDNVVMPAGESNLPDSEIWSYRANDRLRVTSASGPTPVDPARVQVPDQWAELPAFRLSAGNALAITERSRGRAAADNDLHLDRTLWLDYSGDGFVVRDLISGSMRTGWRLDLMPPYELKSASAAGESLLITVGEGDGHTGIELRDPYVDVTAVGRNDTRGEMPVTGWNERFASVSAMLYLPPGQKLLAAPGADVASGSWVSQWQLLDFFLVLIVTIAAWKLFGRAAGIIALVALTLSYHELNAPAWLWLNALIAIALLRVAPAGWLRKTVVSYFGLSALLLVFALVPFIAGQLRIAIYPQLEPQWGMPQRGRAADFAGIASAPPESRPVEQDERSVARTQSENKLQGEMRDAAKSIEEISVTASRVVQSTNFARYAPNAIVQVGPGIASWQWNGNRLGWSGPVDKDQAMRLVILPRWFVTLTRFVEVFVLLLFAAVLVADVLRRRWTLPGGLTIGRSATATALLAGLCLGLSAPQPVQADTPSPELLRELEARLTAPPDCVPQCADIIEAVVAASADSVTINLVVNAHEDVAIPLPGSARGWRPDAVAIEGSPYAEILRAPNQDFWLRVPAGRHSVTLRGSADGADNLEIAFPTPPRVIEASGDAWFIAGIKDRRLLSGSLQLTRLQTASGGDATPRWESNRFPSFVQVTRFVELGLDWRVTTTVQRLAPVQGAITLELPLVDGESVLTDNMTVNDGRILVSMNPTQGRVTWQSTLPRKSPLQLAAGPGTSWKETWRVGVGAVWHADFSGVPESESGDNGDGVRIAEFNPRGGEVLTVVATRPDAVPGNTLVFDSVTVSVAQGARSRTSTLSLNYRSSRGEQHVIHLPADADVTRVTIDGRTESLRATDGELALDILPGEHTVQVEWREEGDIGAVSRTPEIDLGAAASNISLRQVLPENRWLLATNGPRLGPAVLYWSELAFMILLALVLGRIDWTPLSTWQWLLLGLGFSTFNWPVLMLVAAWLVVVGGRDRLRVDMSWWRYNLVQVGLVLLTIAALGAIVVSLPLGLLGTPDMHVTGNGSWHNELSWFADRSDSVLPTTMAFTVPMWIYKALILAWALWLSFALLQWLPWTWKCFSRDGYFRSRRSDSNATAESEA